MGEKKKHVEIREPGFLVLMNLFKTSVAVTGGFDKQEPILGAPPIKNEFERFNLVEEGGEVLDGPGVHAPVLCHFQRRLISNPRNFTRYHGHF